MGGRKRDAMTVKSRVAVNERERERESKRQRENEGVSERTNDRWSYENDGGLLQRGLAGRAVERQREPMNRR